mgnify:FL=1
MKVGDKVSILRTDIKSLEHRKKPVYGRITGIDGEYILVKPQWCRWVIELYRSEIKAI